MTREQAIDRAIDLAIDGAAAIALANGDVMLAEKLATLFEQHLKEFGYRVVPA